MLLLKLHTATSSCKIIVIKKRYVNCPALSFISPANMVLLESLNLKLIDIDKDTLTLDPKLIEKITKNKSNNYCSSNTFS